MLSPNAQQVVLVEGKDCGPGHHSQPVPVHHRFRLILSGILSCVAMESGFARMRTGTEKKVSSQAGLVVDQGNVGAIFHRRQRRRHAGRAAADYGYVGVVVPVLPMGLGDVIDVDLTQAANAADDVPGQPPEHLGSMQSFVVKANRHEPSQAVEDRKEVPLQRRPRVLVSDPHTRLYGLGTGPDIGHAVDVDKAVRTPPVATEQSPGPVVFEAAAESRDAGRVKRGSDGVALKGGHLLAVELEFDCRSAVDLFTGLGRQSGTKVSFGHWLRPDRSPGPG